MVVDPNGPPCPCGRRGCWERYASGSAISLEAKRAAAVDGRLGELVHTAGSIDAITSASTCRRRPPRATPTRSP